MDNDQHLCQKEYPTSGEILVVEDTLASLKLLSDLLNAEGYTVREATNGELALWTVSVRTPDLILLDVRMPGMSGLEVCRRLKEQAQTAAIPVIFLSALADADDKIVGFAVGAVDYIGKPYHPGEVLARVRTHIKLRQLSQELEAERQSLEEKVQQRSADVKALLDAAAEVAIIATDTQGRIKVFNRGAERMLGYTGQEMMGCSPAVFHCPDEVQIRAQKFSTLLGRPVSGFETFVALARDGVTEPCTWTYIRKDGQRLQVSLAVSAVHDVQGKLNGFLGIARDITEQLHAQAELMKLNSQLDKRVQERTSALQETTLQLQDALDDLRLTQSKLVKAENIAAMSTIVTAVAHELNTPIGNCLTITTTLADKTKEIQDNIVANVLRRTHLDEYLQTVHEGTSMLIGGMERAAELVNNFKRVAETGSSLVRCEFDLNQHVKKLIDHLRNKLPDANYRLELQTSTHIIMDSYPESIEQIITYLVDNSLRHGFAGCNHGLMHLTIQSTDDGLSLLYRDDGVGMSEHVQNHIFDPFFTTRLGQGSNGLGMSICYNLINGPLGGRIEVSSQSGAGSSFFISLPCVAPNKEI